MKLWSKRDALPEVKDVEAYCVTLTKNMCVDRLRLAEVEEVDVETMTLPIAATDDVARRIEERDTVEHVKAFVVTLPENQQRVITLRDMEERSFEEIEQMTGLTAVNVRALLSRSRKAIRERFKSYNI